MHIDINYWQLHMDEIYFDNKEKHDEGWIRDQGVSCKPYFFGGLEIVARPIIFCQGCLLLLWRVREMESENEI